MSAYYKNIRKRLVEETRKVRLKTIWKDPDNFILNEISQSTIFQKFINEQNS